MSQAVDLDPIARAQAKAEAEEREAALWSLAVEGAFLRTCAKIDRAFKGICGGHHR